MLSISVRGAGALLLAMALVLAAMPWAIEWLRRLKAQQSIREDVPQAHQAKAGTPTMGGLVIIAALVTATLALAAAVDLFAGLGLGLILAFGGIGFVDDFLIVKRGRNLGLRAREKMALQVVFAGIFSMAVVRAFPPGTGQAGWLSLEPLARALTAPFELFSPGLGLQLLPGVYVLLDVLFLVGLANAVNFSDGLDGLAGGLTAIAGIAAALLPIPIPDAMRVLMLAMAGSCLGFLWYNGNPARVFMGDTGSLALGGALGAFAILTRTELLFMVLGAVYWAELFSVMLQVAYFKATGGRRIFRMSPIHHHFELVGWKEGQIVTRFWLLGAAAGVLAVLLAQLG